MKKCLVCGNPFEEPAGRGRPSEICSAKCRAARKNSQRAQSRKRAQARGIPPHLHGTSTGSTHYRCSCAKCRKWSREYRQTLRLAAKGR